MKIKSIKAKCNIKYPDSQWTVVGYYPDLDKPFCCYTGSKNEKCTAEDAMKEVCETNKLRGDKLIIIGAVFGGNIMSYFETPLKTYKSQKV